MEIEMNKNVAKANVKNSGYRYRVSLKIFAALLFLLLSGSGNSASAFQNTSADSGILKVYNAAIYDSAVYKFSNVRKLYPLKFNPDTKSATVVTLTGYDYTGGGKYKPPFRTDSGTHYTWVTPVPEVQNVCKDFSPGELQLSLSQLLGLPPDSSFKYFVTIEVTSGQIFRPAANPDPTIEYPCAVASAANDKESAIPANCGEEFQPDACGVDYDYKIWFLNKTLSTYSVSDDPKIEGYPWTRLGYTYNWKPGADKYGASEYVIKQNAVVTIKDITPFEKYCQPTK